MNHSLAAVAGRIQERNNALRSELATLELLENQRTDADRNLEAERTSSADARRRLLVAVRNRHGAEIELHRIDDEVRGVDASIEALRSEAARIRAGTKGMERTFEEEHAPLYAAHDASTRLHARRCEARLAAAERRKRRREGRLRDLRERTERHGEEAAGMRAEAGRVREEWLETDRREDEDDEEAVALNMQIKSVLAQKASLRKALNDARAMQQTASSNRDEWEQRCAEGR